MSDERKLEVAQLDATMRSPAGRSVILRILRESGVFSSTFNSDPVNMAYYNGKRDFGLWLISEMEEANKAVLANIMKENFDDNGN